MSKAIANVTPTVTAYVGSGTGQLIKAGSLAVGASQLKPDGGSGKSAEARATG